MLYNDTEGNAGGGGIRTLRGADWKPALGPPRPHVTVQGEGSVERSPLWLLVAICCKMTHELRLSVVVSVVVALARVLGIGVGAEGAPTSILTGH
jgi:hypothetical protein